MTALNDWRKPCDEHNKYDEHVIYQLDRSGTTHVVGRCPGGSPVTLADLEGIGEKAWYCDYEMGIWQHRNTPLDRCNDHTGCAWRILIPLDALAEVEK